MTRTNDERFEDSPPNVDPRTWAQDEDAAKTPVRPHARPAPVVLASLAGPRAPYSVSPLPGPAARMTPPGNGPRTLAALGRAPKPGRKPTTPGLGQVVDPFPAEEAPTPPTAETRAAAELMREGQRLLRNWRACPPEKRRLISAAALQYRESAEGQGRKT